MRNVIRFSDFTNRITNDEVRNVIRPQNITVNLSSEAYVPPFIGERFRNLDNDATLVSGDTNTVYTNTGAATIVNVDLPPGELGLKFTFLITNSSGFRLNADGTENIRIGGSSSGIMTCTNLGGSVVLYGQQGGGYIASSAMETWIDS